MLDAYSKSFSHLNIDNKKFVEFKKQIIEDMNVEDFVNRISMGGGFKWKWDNSHKPAEWRVFNDGQSFEKVGSSNWYAIFGDVYLEKGIHQWDMMLEKNEYESVCFGL